MFVRWVPSYQDVLELNFDGSLKGVGGAGFIIRDLEDKVLYAGSRVFQAVFVPCAELRATWEGIFVVAYTLQARKIIIESDSMVVISWLKEEGCWTQSHPLVLDLHCLVKHEAL